MNCKPGDLAVIVAAHPAVSEIIGRIVTVKARNVVSEEGQHCWDTDPQILIFGRHRAIPDRDMRPIQTPGDDVPDESTAWLPPVPLHNEATA